jgi:nicotinamidase-related amidase
MAATLEVADNRIEMPFAAVRCRLLAQRCVRRASLASILPEGRKTVNICPNSGVIRGIPANYQSREAFMQRNLIAAMAASMMTAALALALPAQAANIVDEWAGIKAPAAPELKPVTVDAKTTALLMLDFMNQSCGQRPRCVASIPAMKKLLAEARAAKVLVVHAILVNTTAADVIKDVAPLAHEPRVQAGPDKFLGTDLEKTLKDKGITTVIVTGTASNGAVLYTASGAVFRGMNAIVPVDGMSAVDPYAELSTVFTFMNAPRVSAKTTLTRSDMIKF